MKYSDFEEAMSPERMRKYVQACSGDTKRARSPEFAIWEARISAFAMRENNDKWLTWYDSPTDQWWGCRAVTPWQPQD